MTSQGYAAEGGRMVAVFTGTLVAGVLVVGGFTSFMSESPDRGGTDLSPIAPANAAAAVRSANVAEAPALPQESKPAEKLARPKPAAPARPRVEIVRTVITPTRINVWVRVANRGTKAVALRPALLVSGVRPLTGLAEPDAGDAIRGPVKSGGNASGMLRFRVGPGVAQALQTSGALRLKIAGGTVESKLK